MESVGLKIALILMLSVITGHCSYSKGGSSHNDLNRVIVLNDTKWSQVSCDFENVCFMYFYSNECPQHDCFDLEKIWQELAKDIKNWKSVVQMASVNCSNDLNLELCKTFEVDKYPQVIVCNQRINKYKVVEIPIFVSKNEKVRQLRNKIIDFIMENLADTPEWAFLRSISYDEEDKIYFIKSNDPTFILVEDTKSYIGSEIILDTSSYWGNFNFIRVRDAQRRFVNSVATTNRDKIQFPAILKKKENGFEVFASSEHHYISGELEKIRHKFLVKLEAFFVLNKIAKTEDFARFEPEDGLFYSDLYKTLRYSIYDEIVSRFQKLNQEQVNITKAYFSIVYKYLPADNENVRRFFKRMNNWLLTKSGAISIADFNAKIKMGDGFLPQIPEWKHCRGSHQHFRGYHCGVWILFHTLTVHEYKKHLNQSRNSNFQHEVLPAMRGFVREFFSCEECESIKFNNELSNQELSAPESSVLWLWRKHNEINRLIKGRASEDPFHPKVEFPSENMCPNCQNDNNQVVEYLVQYYSKFRKSASDQIKADSMKVILFLMILLFV